MFYFKFKIPTHKDGTPVMYSPGWCGTREKCAVNEKGLFYNDIEHWGIGQADGEYVPDDVEVLKESVALEYINNEISKVTPESSGVLFTIRLFQKITHK
jgi:hypothetical protein